MVLKTNLNTFCNMEYPLKHETKALLYKHLVNYLL